MAPVRISNNFQKHTATEGSKDNAHIFYGRICQNAFDIHFHLSIQNTQESRNQTKNHNDNCPPVIPFGQEIKHKTTKAVKSNFKHNTTHQRRHVTGCSRMGVGQPNMQRNKARFQSKANERSSKGCVHHTAFQSIICHLRKAKAFTMSSSQEESNHNSSSTNGCHYQILVSSIPSSALFCFVVYQQEGSHCHNFPEQQEAQSIAC